MKFYPSYLPAPQIDYSYANNNRTIQNSFESGRISQRSLATTQRDIINVVFQFNQFQLGVFESFVQTTLGNGVLKFTISLPDSITGGVTPTVVLLSEGKYSTTSIAGLLVWKVAATLIRQDKTAFTQDDLDLFAEIAGEYGDVIFQSNEFNELLHELLPDIF